MAPVVKVLHRNKEGKPTTVFLEKPYHAFDVKDEDLLRLFLSAERIHAWVSVQVGSVSFRNVWATASPPIKSPQFKSEPLIPLRSPEMLFPNDQKLPEDLSIVIATPVEFKASCGKPGMSRCIYVITDPENDARGDKDKCLRAGLWFSSRLAGGTTIVGYEGKLYLVPKADKDRFPANLLSQGEGAFTGYDTFEDPTAKMVDEFGLIDDPVGTNGTFAPLPAPAMKPQPTGKHLAYQALELLADLRITVVLFVLAILIVFWGTLAQVDNGINTVVRTYFRSAYVWVPLKVVLFNTGDSKLPILFPGGWLIGGTMLVNLLAAHAIRFKLAWNRAGILLIHSGLIVIMLGELITGVFAVETQMQIMIGQTAFHEMHPGTAEFVVILTKNEKEDEVVAVPKSFLKDGAVIDDPKLPFKMEINSYWVNSDLRFYEKHEKVSPQAKGQARNFVAKEAPEVSGVDPNARFDAPALYVNLTTHGGQPLGTWLLSTLFPDAQFIKVGDKDYRIALRPKQSKLPYSMHLTDFKHDVFPGTNTPKDFHCYIQLTDPETGVDRPVEIYMNSPLYYRGKTFYQSQTTEDRMTGTKGTILQVVHNPGWVMPYLACLLVGVGLLIHFGLTLYKFVDRRTVR